MMHVTVHFCNSIDDVGFSSFYNFCGFFFFRYSRLGGDLSTSCWLQIDLQMLGGSLECEGSEQIFTNFSKIKSSRSDY